jgi:hypothetical protein
VEPESQTGGQKRGFIHMLSSPGVCHGSGILRV